MDQELKTLPASINLDGDSPVDIYTNKKPKEKPPKNNIWPIVGIGISLAVIIAIVVAVIVYRSYNQSKGNGENERLQRTDSDTSNIS